MKRFAFMIVLVLAAPAIAAPPPQPKPGVVTLKKMREAAFVLVDNMNTGGALQQQMNRMIDEQITAVRAIPCAESAAPAVRTILENTLSFDAMRPALANVYVNNFTLAELEWMVNFYQTGLGKKLLDVQPALYETMSTISAGRIKEAEPQITGAIRTATNNVQCQQQLQRR
ncbi:MAG: DUF2059 domain-containing protein [Rickettsiales bacterium]